MVEECQNTPNLPIESSSSRSPTIITIHHHQRHEKEEEITLLSTPKKQSNDNNKKQFMSAVIAKGPHKNYNLHSKSIPIPTLSSPHDVVLKVEACGICASDGKMYNSNNDFYWHPKTGRCCSCSSSNGSDGGVIPGHEFVGKVINVGTAATDVNGTPLQIHDVIVVEPAAHFCQNCTQCIDGNTHKCRYMKLYGQGLNGGMGQYVLIYGEHSRMHLIPKALSSSRSMKSVVLCEPLSVSLHAVDRARDGMIKFAKRSWRRNMSRSKKMKRNLLLEEEKKDNETYYHDAQLEPVIVSVGGCGTIGLGVIIVLRHLFPNGIPLREDEIILPPTTIVETTTNSIIYVPLKIIAIDCGKAYKLDVAREVGADVCIDVAVNNQQQEDMSCDVYFEASGNPSSIQQGIQCLKPCGRFIHLGISDDALHSSSTKTPSSSITAITSLQFWNTISAKKELEIYGSSLSGNIYDYVWQRTIQMLSTDMEARNKCERLVTHSLPLKYFREAHEIMIRSDLEMMAQSIKIVIEHGLDEYCVFDDDDNDDDEKNKKKKDVEHLKELVRKERNVDEEENKVIIMTKKSDGSKGVIVMRKGCFWPSAWKMHDLSVSAEEMVAPTLTEIGQNDK